jgi:hypothetical protein
MITEQNFIKQLNALWKVHRNELSSEFSSAQQLRQDPDWVWNIYVMSMCTFGGSENYRNKRNKYGTKIQWHSILNMSQENRTALFFDLPNPRRRHIITPALESTFQRIREAGGPSCVAENYVALHSAKDKMKFWLSFKGIGKKYCRNIPMDIGDESFLDHIALDSRLNGLIDKVEGAPPSTNYEARERFVIELGQQAEIPNAWFLDRLLYGFHNEFKI